MAKWEHWFWITIFLLFQARVRGQHLEFIDTLTAPTLRPEAAQPPRPPFDLGKQPSPSSLIRNEEKLTIITPSSIVVMSTARPRPQPASSLRPPITASSMTTTEDRLNDTKKNLEDVSVSHSVSVVSVKYSSSSEAVNSAAASEAAITTQMTSTPQTTTSSAGLSNSGDFSRNGQSSRPLAASSEAALTNRAPKAIVQSNRLFTVVPRLSATSLRPVISTTSAASTTEATVNLEAVEPIEEVKYEHISEETTSVVTEIKPILSKSETAQALDELGFEYNEYMDDTDLLGDESNDEVIPPFREEEEYFAGDARAAPSKVLYTESLDNELREGKMTASRQNNKAPLPHYEPTTIIAITIGAFLLIFIGTVGLGAFIYHERYVNKPHALDDGFSDSGGCSTSVNDDSIGRVSHIECSGLDIPTDTYCEEMYNLDNDSFLNSLETVAMPTMLWSVAPNSDSDV